MIKYDITFHPSWWHQNAGIDFSQPFFDDPEYRMDIVHDVVKPERIHAIDKDLIFAKIIDPVIVHRDIRCTVAEMFDEIRPVIAKYHNSHHSSKQHVQRIDTQAVQNKPHTSPG